MNGGKDDGKNDKIQGSSIQVSGKGRGNRERMRGAKL